jgi:ribonucleotide monophosphatase NagD (HAD superfamily)
MRFADFDAILFDMDGTLYREHHGLPGASEVIEHLRATRKRFACITNNSANTSEELSQRLASMGVNLEPAAIYTACHAMADWVRKFPANGGTPRIFNFAGNALPRELAGEAAFVDSPDAPCDIVAVATHMRENAVPFDFERSLVGLNILRRGAHLLVGCADRVFPIRGGVEFGSGSWGVLFQFGAAVPPERVYHAGKPEPGFFHSLCRRLGVDPHRCLIIGDNLESDIQGGLRVGMKTALLLTGITRQSDISTSRHQPDVVFEDLPHLMRAMA